MGSMKYPIGVQSFERIREQGYTYIDKTELIYDMVNSYDNVFLSRPRRFGKSLLTSTLECYFQGRKDLFEGLAIEKLEKEWKEYPVLHFDMSGIGVKGDVEENIVNQLRNYEKLYAVDYIATSLDVRLTNVLAAAKEVTGMPPVVLIDEYDKPVLEVIGDKGKMEDVRDTIQTFFAPLKGANLRFLFLTGITKFSQMSIFSRLNNLKNISMMPKYSALCGITEEEMLRDLDEGISKMADVNDWTKEECVENLKRNYDGYHFSHTSPDIYNPFSLLQAVESAEIGSYWYAMTPTFIIEQMKRYDVMPQDIHRKTCWEGDFDVPIEDMKSITPLLYQTGYLTIKDFKKPQEYTLDIPNVEVKDGLMKSLLPYLNPCQKITASEIIRNMRDAFYDDDFDSVMKHLQTYLSTVPYTSVKDSEGHYQSLLYVLFSLMCNYVQVEVRTPQGRVDLLVETPQFIYLVEIKLNKSADLAIDQINLKHYADKFSLDTKPVKKVGVNFSTETRNITDWKVL